MAITALLQGLKFYWKPLAVLAVTLSLIGYIGFLRLQRDNIELSFTNYRLAIESAAKEQETRNKLLQEQSNQRALINEQVYSREIEKQQVEIGKLSGANANLVSVNSGLRSAADSARSELSRILIASQLPPESGRNCDPELTYIRNLVAACKQTTIDYNALRKWVDDQCEIYTCR